MQYVQTVTKNELKPGNMIPERQRYFHELDPKRDKPPKLAERMAAQANGLTFQQYADSVGHLNSVLHRQ